jgi:hypothetical protein
MRLTTRILLVSCLGLLLAACKEQAVYSQESFAADSPFKLRTKSTVGDACESARRALLGQGYLIDEASDEKVKGRKAYQVGGDRNNQIEMNVVCIGERRGSTLFATGVLSTYELKTSGSSASVGVSAVGSISLPIGKSADSLVKVGEQTISDAEFYRRFFSAVQLTLGEIEEAGGDTDVAPAPIPPEPGPAPATVLAPAPATEPATPPATEPAAVPAAQPAPVPTAPSAVPGAQPLPAGPATPSATETVPAAPGNAIVQPAPSPEPILAPSSSSEAPTTVPVAPAPAASPVTPPEAVPELPGASVVPPVVEPENPAPAAPATSAPPAGSKPAPPGSLEVVPQPPDTPEDTEDPAALFEP